MISLEEALQLEYRTPNQLGVNLNQVEMPGIDMDTDTRATLTDLIESRLWKLTAHLLLNYPARGEPIPDRFIQFMRPEEREMMDEICAAISRCRSRLIPREIHPDQARLGDWG